MRKRRKILRCVTRNEMLALEECSACSDPDTLFDSQEASSRCPVKENYCNPAARRAALTLNLNEIDWAFTPSLGPRACHGTRSEGLLARPPPPLPPLGAPPPTIGPGGQLASP